MLRPLFLERILHYINKLLKLFIWSTAPGSENHTLENTDPQDNGRQEIHTSEVLYDRDDILIV